MTQSAITAHEYNLFIFSFQQTVTSFVLSEGISDETLPE